MERDEKTMDGRIRGAPTRTKTDWRSTTVAIVLMALAVIPVVLWFLSTLRNAAIAAGALLIIPLAALIADHRIPQARRTSRLRDVLNMCIVFPSFVAFWILEVEAFYLIRRAMGIHTPLSSDGRQILAIMTMAISIVLSISLQLFRKEPLDSWIRVRDSFKGLVLSALIPGIPASLIWLASFLPTLAEFLAGVIALFCWLGSVISIGKLAEPPVDKRRLLMIRVLSFVMLTFPFIAAWLIPPMLAPLIHQGASQVLAWALLSAIGFILISAIVLSIKAQRAQMRFALSDLIVAHLSLESVVNGNLLTSIPGQDSPRYCVAHALNQVGLAHTDWQSLTCPEYRAFWQERLPEPVRTKLAALPPKQGYTDHDTVKAILPEDAPCEEVAASVSYVFPDGDYARYAADCPDVVWLRPREGAYGKRARLRDVRHRAYAPIMRAAPNPQRPYPNVFAAFIACFREPSIPFNAIFAVVKDGQVVSVCQSARESTVAAEAWVRTLPEYRGMGYARQVTAAWAYYVARRHKIAFYSHLQDNAASASVARGLGLIPFAEEVAYA